MEQWHAAKPGSIVNGTAAPKKKANGSAAAKAKPQYTTVFGNALVDEARRDERVLGITAAMNSGTGLNILQRELPDRYYDVGIAEQHAVLFAAGLALQGAKPVAAIYSTFLQRGYDQIVHDVCLQKLDVVFAMDRAGLVGDDGPTHHGAFDISYLRCLPNIVLMAPRDEAALVDMLHTALAHDGPIALRYPRGEGEGVPLPSEPAAARDRPRRAAARGRARRAARLRLRRPGRARRGRGAGRRARHRADRRRRPLRQAARRRAARAAGLRARAARDRRGERARRRLRLRRARAARRRATCSAARACCGSACPTASSHTASRLCCARRSASQRRASPPVWPRPSRSRAWLDRASRYSGASDIIRNELPKGSRKPTSKP